PHFDVLIVDEASKTTLQEFLVPAQLAQRWIIVGDVRQLPPFTEPKDLEASLTEVSEDDRQGQPKRLSEAYQRACLLFAELEKDEAGAKRVRWLIDEPPEVLDALVAEMLARKEINGTGPFFVRLVKNASAPCDVTVSDLQSGAVKALELLAAHWVLVATDLLPVVERFLPGGLVRLRSGEDLPAHAFRHHHWVTAKGRLEPPVRVRRGQAHQDVTSLRDAVREFFREQTWAKQIAWRLGRVHQLGNAKNASDRKARQEEIERLLPAAIGASWVAPAVDAIRDVGVRSVIEALRVPRTEHRVRRRSALTDAIPPKMWTERSKLLTRQHRMHPDISGFPREQFYDQLALINANTLDNRDAKIGWTFMPDQPSRRVWVDVAGHEVRGTNPDEVEAMRRVLEAWCTWPAKNPRQDGKRGEVACLAFYARQEHAIRDMLRKLTGQHSAETRFELPNTRIACATVDRFQGREADLVLLSFRNVKRPGHADSPNRLNVAITRARFQLVLFGNKNYFENCHSDELSALALATPRAKPI
ncbi:MAG TPA: AAA domain-containing protein, partial [Polyangium sp.]|nr:AAA domain-containing protein [Polyangium sp.]